MKKLCLKPLMSVVESDKWEGRMLEQKDCKILIGEDADIYDKESGKCLAKFRKAVIPGNICKLAYDNLLKAASLTDSRAVAAAGKKEGKASTLRLKKNGTFSKQTVSRNGVKINSGVAGYYDRSTRFPNCRLTAFNRHHFDKFINAYPIIKLVDSKYAELMPVEYKLQQKLADKTAKDFVIKDTVFTTVTVNKNYKTAVHKDVGDFKQGFGNLVALRKGSFKGCHLVMVRWGVGFDLQNGDLLLMDVHQWHGNTPQIKDPGAVRLSLVMYYREKMIECGTMEQELERVKNRKLGEPLYDKKNK